MDDRILTSSQTGAENDARGKPSEETLVLYHPKIPNCIYARRVSQREKKAVLRRAWQRAPRSPWAPSKIVCSVHSEALSQVT